MISTDLTGKRFDRITVLERVGSNKHKKVLWKCRCDCGTEKVIVGAAMTSGNTKSCGCHRRENSSKRMTKHGLRHHPVYHTWVSMRDRCNNPNNSKYSDYGGRGITICSEWDSFEVFLKDMGEKPFTGAEIDRIDNSKGYSPDNCRWVTRTSNMRNTRFNNNWTYNGITQCVSAWAEALNTTASTLIQRVNLLGWSIEKTLSTPVVIGRNQYSDSARSAA